MPRADEELIRAAQANPQAFEALYRQYREAVFRYLWFHVDRDTTLAEDLTQETFLKVFAALPNYRQRGSAYRTYLLTVAHNVLVSFFRKRAAVPLEAAERLADDPRERVLRHLEADRLWSVAVQLPTAERSALLLFYQQDRSIQDMARILGRTPNAVKLLLSRARRRLRQLAIDPKHLAHHPRVRPRYAPPRFPLRPDTLSRGAR